MIYSNISEGQVAAFHNLLLMLRKLRAVGVVETEVNRSPTAQYVHERTFCVSIKRHLPGIYKTKMEIMEESLWKSFAALDALGLAFDDPGEQSTS